MPKNPTMLLILDGFGWREETADNAVALARTPNFDELWETCPHAFLRTSGDDVGLPDGQMGNSEVGTSEYRGGAGGSAGAGADRGSDSGWQLGADAGFGGPG